MAKKQEVLKELEFLSNQISSQVRAIALGIIITIWGLLFSSERYSVFTIDPITKIWFVRVALISLSVLLFDYLQYLSGYVNAYSLEDYMEKNQIEEAEYNYTSCSYQLREIFFLG